MADQDIEQWTFYSSESTERFSIPVTVAQLSETFSTMIKSSQNEKAVSLQIVEQPIEHTNKTYLINTNHLLKYVYKYFKIWENAPEKANYVKEEPVQTSEIQHILKQVDIDLIEEYLEEYLRTNNISALDDHTKIRNMQKEGLGVLLSQVDEFLNIKCFANKLYAYIAVLIWNTSVVDFADAMQDPEFYKAQQAAVEAWKLDNESHFASYIRTNGNIALAPIISKEQLDEYLENESHLTSIVDEDTNDAEYTDVSDKSDDE